MKKKSIKSLFLSVLSLSLLFVGCSQSDEDIVYPLKKETIDFSLLQVSNISQNTKADTVYLISSDEELAKYNSNQSGMLPKIDFDKYSLIFVRGINTSGIQSITRDLEQTSISECKLNVDITSNMTTVVQPWIVAVLTEKLPKNSIIKLSLKRH